MVLGSILNTLSNTEYIMRCETDIYIYIHVLFYTLGVEYYLCTELLS
jgi:hypothetical protein